MLKCYWFISSLVDWNAENAGILAKGFMRESTRLTKFLKLRKSFGNLVTEQPPEKTNELMNK